MEKLSGLVLDVYDDPDGEILRGIFPTYEEVPDLIKEAHQLDSGERDQLPDELFALVLVDEDTVLRKLACVDAGNTALAVEYFLKTAHKLPLEAQKVAAENLVTACGWYDLEPPEVLGKMAGMAFNALRSASGGNLGLAMNAVTAPGIIQGTSQEVKNKMQGAKASGASVNPAIIQA
jgi:hypothetical protein